MASHSSHYVQQKNVFLCFNFRNLTSTVTYVTRTMIFVINSYIDSIRFVAFQVWPLPVIIRTLNLTAGNALGVIIIIIIIISNLSNDRSKASSKTIPPHSAI